MTFSEILAASTGKYSLATIDSAGHLIVTIDDTPYDMGSISLPVTYDKSFFVTVTEILQLLTLGSSGAVSSVSPAGLTITSAAQNSLTATWEPVVNAIGYTVTLDTNDPITVTGTTTTFKNLDPSSEHTVEVYAVLGIPSKSSTSSGSVLAAPILPSIQQAILADSPDYYWPFDDPTGTASPKQLGTKTSTISAVETPGLTGTSTTFFAGDDCWAVSTSVLEGATAFTVEAIIHGGTPNDSSSGAWLSFPNGLTAYYDPQDGLGFQINTTDPTDNFVFKNWYSATDTAKHHVALRWDGTSAQIYLDGQPSQYGPYTVKGTLLESSPAPANVWIGAAAGTASGLEMSDVAIWRSALDPSIIASHATAA